MKAAGWTALFSMVLLLHPVGAAIYTLEPDGSGDFATIQEAIDSALDGDTIELTNGLYRGDGNRDLDYLGKAIRIRSQSGIPDSCIIDCEGSSERNHRGFYFRRAENGSSVLEGITVTNGYEGLSGGGIACQNASPTIRNCVLRGNTTEYAGGGLSVLNNATTAAIVVADCEFSENSARAFGGGVYAVVPADSVVDVRGCLFSGNEVTGESSGLAAGGGLACGAGMLRVSDCTFSGNRAPAAGGIYAPWSAINVVGCTIVENDDYGVVWSAATGLEAVLENVIVVGNSGGSLLCATDNITLRCSDIYDNNGKDWIEPFADQVGQSGNVALDPLFCDAEGGDYRLTESSPCASENSEGCGQIGSLTVGCAGPPVACFEADPDSGSSGLEVQFDPSCSRGEVDSWYWDFGNGEEFQGQYPPRVTYVTDLPMQDFSVVLTVTGPGGTSETVRMIHVWSELQEFTYPSPFPRGRYFLVTLPVSVGEERRLSEVLGELGPPGRTSWMGFGYSADRLEEDPYVSPGSGYWIAIARSHPAVTVEGRSFRGSLAVRLEEGWNIIGVPTLDHPFAWSEARLAVGQDTVGFADQGATSLTEPHLHWWSDTTPDLVNDGEYEEVLIDGGFSNASQWGAYFLYAQSPCTLLFPGLEAIRTMSPQVRSTLVDARPEPSWTMDVSVRAGQGADRGVILGVQPGSREGYDDSDILKPPFPFRGPRLAVVQDGPGWHEFQQVYGSPETPGHEWVLKVESGTETATLDWAGVTRIPDDLNLYLLDPRTQRAVDMRRERSFEFVLDNGERTFTVRVGRDPYAGEVLAPAATALRRCSPNPTRGGLTIQFTVGRAGRVQIGLFDVTGRLVDTLYDRPTDRGEETVLWDGSHQPLSSGIYFVRLRAKDGSVTQRVAIVR